jgi:hypothetical protein
LCRRGSARSILREVPADAESPPSLWDLYTIAPASLSISYAALDKYPHAKHPPALRQINAASSVQVAVRLAEGYRKEQRMLDLILLALGLGFFALSVAYAFGCDRL